MLLYSRKKVRYRRDGYCWKKRKDGKTTREDHMKLKVQGTEGLGNPDSRLFGDRCDPAGQWDSRGRPGVGTSSSSSSRNMSKMRIIALKFSSSQRTGTQDCHLFMGKKASGVVKWAREAWSQSFKIKPLANQQYTQAGDAKRFVATAAERSGADAVCLLINA
ncbi:hypothetical protein ACJJTC_010586 [Scirpophaga incertulas]